jgi:hypothetical protein
MLVCNPRIMTFKFTVPDMMPSEGIQKIAGFSRGHHHINSVRIGINRSEDTSTCRLFLYTYLNGKQISKYICEVQVGELCHVTLKMSRYEYYCIVNEVAQGFTFPSRRTLPIGYTLGSYAEEDHTGVRVPFEVEVKNIIVV